MAAIDEDDKPKKKIAHEIGQDLSLLSVEELAQRVQLLHDEINRLEADMAQKRASRSAADQFFSAEFLPPEVAAKQPAQDGVLLAQKSSIGGNLLRSW